MGRKEDDQEQWEWCQKWRREHKKWIVKSICPGTGRVFEVRSFYYKSLAYFYAVMLKVVGWKVEIEQEK